MEVITLCLLRPCFQEDLANTANSLCIEQAEVLKVITDGIQKGGIIEIGNVKRAGDVIGALSYNRSYNERHKQHKNKKNSSFPSKKRTAAF